MVVLLIIFCLMALSVVVWTVKNGISPMPTTPKVARALQSMLPTLDTGPIVELGSGWGHLALRLARHYPELEVIGYETSPVPYYYSCLLGFITGQKNLRFIRKDFFNVPLDKARLVVCYLYPAAMEKLKNKLENEAQKGLFVLTHTFSLPGWQPVKTSSVDDLYSTKIYLYLR